MALNMLIYEDCNIIKVISICLTTVMHIKQMKWLKINVNPELYRFTTHYISNCELLNIITCISNETIMDGV